MDTSSNQTTGASAKKAADTVADRVEDLANDVSAKTKSAGEQARRGVSELESNLTRGAEDLAASVGATLRSVGVDTDRMTDIAKEQATDLQRLIVQEIQDRPLRALGVAAAIGLFVGFLSAR